MTSISKKPGPGGNSLKLSAAMMLLVFLGTLTGCLTSLDVPSTAGGQMELAKIYMARNKVDDAITLYRQVATTFPQDSSAPEAMFNIGVTYQEFKMDWQAAIDTFEDLVLKYPDSSRADDALLRAGFMYDENKKDPSKAMQTYRKILSEYSSGDMAPGAREKIQNLQYRGY